MVDTVFEDVLVVVVVDDIDIPDGAEEDLLSEVADLFVAVVVVGVVAESDDDAGKVEEIQLFKKKIMKLIYSTVSKEIQKNRVDRTVQTIACSSLPSQQWDSSITR